MDLKFDGKVAVITGGARGIGYATAAMMARGGGKVALVDINGEQVQASATKLADETGARVIGIRTDVTSQADIEAMARHVESDLGPVDVLVTSAAIVDDKLFLESKPADWHRMIDICLYGPMLCLHVLLPGMVQRKYGRV